MIGRQMKRCVCWMVSRVPHSDSSRFECETLSFTPWSKLIYTTVDLHNKVVDTQYEHNRITLIKTKDSIAPNTKHLIGYHALKNA